MTRMRRIIADKAKKIGVNPLYPCHPHSIDAFFSTEPVNLQSEFAICDRRAFGGAAGEVGRFGADHRHASARHRQSLILICEDRFQARIVRGGDAVWRSEDWPLG